ncbi:hypothetical protein BVK86_10980 [Pseudomonas reinekei]|uniref:Uncharacterized protein n=1 Tax=Pseudomonas reinekei TaxID=395598 RepID=A0A1Q9WYD7_PSERE|nr:hypothetical protein BVK86_10980 [Pseudomonas reinekei]
MAAGRHETGDREERGKGRDQALHGEILENALIAPEYTGHPAACLCEGAPVRRGLAASTSNPVGAGSPAIAEVQSTLMLNLPALSRASPLPQGEVLGPLGRYPLQSTGLARILRRLSLIRHFLRLPQ